MKRRVRPGDGRPLEPFRWWQLFTGRHLLYLTVEHADGGRSDYALDVRLSGKQASDEGMAYLYRGSRQLFRSALPARFPVEGGAIEASYGTVGLKRAHYVTADGERHPLSADPRSAIGRRLRFARTHPRTSTAIGAASVLLLLVGVGVNGLQIVESLLQIPPIVERFGRFESPLHLPVWLNITLALAAALGASERALRLRYNWLLDGVGI